MKKIGLLLLIGLVATASAQTEPASGEVIATNANLPTVRFQTPTNADIYCAGFINKQLLPNANFVAGGLNTPNTTKYVNGDIVYLAGAGYQPGQRYTVVRELRDPNEYELFSGQHAAIKQMGQPYAEVARVRILDTRSKTAVAQVEFSCDPVNLGDVLIPFAEKPAISFRAPKTFDRFLPPTGKLSGRIVMAKDFDSLIATGSKVYLNVGSNQGVKAGDYFRTTRRYTADLKDPVDSLSFKASISEDTQKKPPSIEAKMFTKNSGPTIHVADLPRRAIGELVILSTTADTATGMLVFALEDVHVGDSIEIDEQ